MWRPPGTSSAWGDEEGGSRRGKRQEKILSLVNLIDQEKNLLKLGEILKIDIPKW